MSHIVNLIRLPFAVKLAFMLFIDSLFITLALWSANITVNRNEALFIEPTIVVVIASLMCFVKFGFYRAVLRFVSYKAIKFIGLGLVASALINYFVLVINNVPNSALVTIVYSSFLTVLIGFSRIIVRASMVSYSNRKKEPVIVYGAGSAGRELAKALENGNQYYVYAFVDDNPRLHRKNFHGIDVYASKRIKSLAAEKDITHVLLAMPSVCVNKRNKILTQLQSLPLKVLTIPSISELVEEK